MKKDWQILSEKIYYRNGSLRDMIIADTTKADYKIWTAIIQDNYKVSHHFFDPEKYKNEIDLEAVFQYWNGSLENISTAGVYLQNNIIVNTHFFTPEQIDSDILPNEFNSIEDHDSLIAYMTLISNSLNKKVILTPEHEPDIILMSVQGDDIVIDI